MDKLQKQQLKTKIRDDINLLTKEIALLEEKVKPIAPDCSLGCLIREELILTQDVDKKTLDLSLQRLNKLKYALNKIDNDEYGVCLECDDDISFERLKILPESVYCVRCLNEK